jgi:hypothetical protein
VQIANALIELPRTLSSSTCYRQTGSNRARLPCPQGDGRAINHKSKGANSLARTRPCLPISRRSGSESRITTDCHPSLARYLRAATRVSRTGPLLQFRCNSSLGSTYPACSLLDAWLGSVAGSRSMALVHPLLLEDRSSGETNTAPVTRTNQVVSKPFLCGNIHIFVQISSTTFIYICLTHRRTKLTRMTPTSRKHAAPC